jgi:hypothetical protein
MASAKAEEFSLRLSRHGANNFSTNNYNATFAPSVRLPTYHPSGHHRNGEKIIERLRLVWDRTANRNRKFEVSRSSS